MKNNLAYICSPYRGNIYQRIRNIVYARNITRLALKLELCVEYGALYITEQHEIDILEHDARQLGYTDLPFIAVSAMRRDGLRIRTVLKSECVKLEKVREKLGNTINIIGIEEI